MYQLRSVQIISCCLLALISSGQVNTNSTRAKLEVDGVATFGLENGITVFNHHLGFNMYVQSQPAAFKYMGNGYVGLIDFISNSTNTLNFTVYAAGSANGTLPSGGITGMNLGTSHGNKIAGFSNTVLALDVGRGTSFNGTAWFSGTNINSHFNYGTEENTYIRGGYATSRVYINDVFNGTIQMGNGTSRIGINYNNPVSTFEIRQASGTGINIGGTANSWEWRVSGSPGNFYARYANAIKGYLRPSDGAYISVSDERLKSDIEDMPGILDKLMQLKPSSYCMIPDNPNKIRSMGFIAQEVQPLFPELIMEIRDSTGIKNLGLYYSAFGVLAIKGVQEEQKKIEELEKQITDSEIQANKIEQAIIKKKRSK